LAATKRGYVCNKSFYELVPAAIISNTRQRRAEYRYEIVFKRGIFLQNEFEFGIDLKFLWSSERF
jgi:hypothetical protein